MPRTFFADDALNASLSAVHWFRVDAQGRDVFSRILLAIGIVAILGNGMANVILAVAVFSVPTFARLVRGSTLVVN